MRKIFLFIATSIFMFFNAKAQSTQLPIDKDVRIGKLESGITYYVRSNPKPENQAEFYILHNVGAIQEEDNQQGLAHFLEHMAFNGTKNLPGKKLINWCESVGIKFGTNLNASTGIERTLYNVSAAPIDRPGVMDTCLLILHDWSQFVDLANEKEIDDERGVIIEEKRTRNSASWRIFEKSLPVLYGNSKYAHRNLIGYEDFLKTFKYDDLRSFYHRWYRPDLQCIVVIGDFNADTVVGKIKKMFADVKPVENPEPKGIYEIADNVDPVIGVFTDPEATSTSVSILIKRKPIPRELNNTENVYRLDMMESLASMMANSRLREISQKPNSPFLGANIFFGGSLTSTCDIAGANASARDGESLKALDAVYAQLEKVRRFGFTQSEFEIAVANYKKMMETSYNNRNDRRNRDFVYEYISNYRDNTPVLDAETEYRLGSKILDNMKVEEVNNEVAKKLITLENQIVTISAPDKEGAEPNETDVLNVINKVRAEKLEAYKDSVVKEPLIADQSELKGSPIVKEEKGKDGETVWTLKNGVKVIVLKTDYKTDEINLSAVSQEGLSNVSDENFYSAQYAPAVASQSGIGKFNLIDLRKILAGKDAWASPNIGYYNCSVTAGGSPKDIETIMQLFYLRFTQPRWDETDFKVFCDKYKSQLVNMETNPDYIYNKEFIKLRYNDNIRRQIISIKMINSIDFAKLPQLYKQFFGDASNFKFIFVGNMKPATLKPFVEKYIGSVPASGKSVKWINDGVKEVKGVVEKTIDVKMETPKTTVGYVWTGDIDFTLENKITINALAQIVRIRYTEVIREEKGATYGVDVSASIAREPAPGYAFVVEFDTNKEKLDSMNILKDVYDGLENVAKNGPRAEDLSKVKEYLIKQRKDDLKQNDTWLNILYNYYVYNFDLSNYDKLLNELDAKKIQSFAEKIIKDNNLVRLIMEPKK